MRSTLAFVAGFLFLSQHSVLAEIATERCPYPAGWKPGAQLNDIISDHQKWLSSRGARPSAVQPATSGGQRANLCNADLAAAELSNVNLSRANLRSALLNGAMLASARLDEADLSFASLADAFASDAIARNANLQGANLINTFFNEAQLDGTNFLGAKMRGIYLQQASLINADLNSADLEQAKLQGAKLRGANFEVANLQDAQFGGAELNNARLVFANMMRADLQGARMIRSDLSHSDLTRANLRSAILIRADLREARLDGCDLTNADLNSAKLIDATLSKAVLAYADLSDAIYAPRSPPPDDHIAGLKGLATLTFPQGRSEGLIQLRRIANLSETRPAARELTYALERGQARHDVGAWSESPAQAVAAALRIAALEWTTGYGLYPGRALLLLVMIGLAVIPVYAMAVTANGSNRAAVFRVDLNPVSRSGAAGISRLQARGMRAVAWSAYFSLSSSVSIWRGFKVALASLQPHSFLLESTGWVRSVAGVQALISAYLVVIWGMTAFFRPFG